MSNQLPRLAIVLSHPIQYQAPLLRRLSASTRVRSEVLFLSRHGTRPSFDRGFDQVVHLDDGLTRGYRHRFLTPVNLRPSVSRRFGLVHPQLLWQLSATRYDVVLIHGWGHASEWIAAAASRIGHLPYMIRGEAVVDPHDVRPSRMRRGGLRALVQGASVCLPIGSQSAKFYESMGVPVQRLVRAVYSVDNERFRRDSAAGVRSRSDVLLELGLDPSAPVVLFAAKLQPWKRPLDVIRALRLVSTPCSVVFAGDGPLRREVEEAGRELPVRVVGFQNQTEIAEWYGRASVLVLPSELDP
jgi:glycosyltransferase involved in cell wall biosynthesis